MVIAPALLSPPYGSNGNSYPGKTIPRSKLTASSAQSKIGSALILSPGRNSRAQLLAARVVGSVRVQPPKSACTICLTCSKVNRLFG